MRYALMTEHRLRTAEYTALAVLADSDRGRLRQQELADAMGMSISTASRTVATLEMLGFVERSLASKTGETQDWRGINTQITALGRKKVEEARPTYLQVLKEAHQETSADYNGPGMSNVDPRTR